MRPLKTITIVEIQKLLKHYLGLSVTKATIYSYIHKKEFPTNTGFGRPRRWREDRVHKWIATQIKKSEKQ